MTETTDTAVPALLLGEAGSDPIEDRLRETVRATVEAIFDEELAAYLGRIRYGRGGAARKGYRHGRRERQLVGTFGTQTVSVPRARIEAEDGRVTEWRSKALPRYQRLTKRAEALIAAVYLAGTNTRRVKRALFGLFQGAVGKDVISRAWRKVKVDWDAWCARSLADEDIVRLILDGTVSRWSGGGSCRSHPPCRRSCALNPLSGRAGISPRSTERSCGETSSCRWLMRTRSIALITLTASHSPAQRSFP